MKNNQVIIDDLVKYLLMTYGPMAVAIALNNASAHGKAIQTWLEVSRMKAEHLTQWYNGIETMMDAAERIVND
jgi:hypothetical protein